MKSNEANAFVFIACVIVGIMIAMNINFSNVNNRVFLSTDQYLESYNSKIRLNNEVDELIDKYSTLNQKFNKYQTGSMNDDAVVDDINNEIKQNKLIVGNSEVQGEGISITLIDASTNDFGEIYDRRQLIHDFDMIYVLNDLKNAGAEAIAVNGQRIIDRTGVICDKQFIDINGVIEPAPYHIDAIGNKEAMTTYMLKDEAYLKYLKSDYRGIIVTFEEKNNIKIPAYNGELNYNYKEINK